MTLSERQYHLIQQAVEFTNQLTFGHFGFLNWMAIEWGLSIADRNLAASYQQSLNQLFNEGKRKLRDQLLGPEGVTAQKQLQQLCNILSSRRAIPSSQEKGQPPKVRVRQALNASSHSTIDGDPAPIVIYTTSSTSEAPVQADLKTETSSDDADEPS